MTSGEQEYYAWNAAMLVTTWGPVKTPEIFDYSWREWSGLIKEYYLPRWRKFHAMLGASIGQGTYRDPGSQCYGRESFRANAFYSELADWELAFIHNGNEIMRDTHEGWAGDPSKAYTFLLNPGPMVFNGKYEIKAKVKTAGGNDSNGVITIRKKTK